MQCVRDYATSSFSYVGRGRGNWQFYGEDDEKTVPTFGAGIEKEP